MTKVTDLALSTLPSTLVELHLQWAEITHVGLQRKEKCTSVTFLEMPCTNLKCLEMRGGNIVDNFQLLPHTLTHLELSCINKALIIDHLRLFMHYAQRFIRTSTWP